MGSKFAGRSETLAGADTGRIATTSTPKVILLSRHHVANASTGLRLANAPMGIDADFCMARMMMAPGFKRSREVLGPHKVKVVAVMLLVAGRRRRRSESRVYEIPQPRSLTRSAITTSKDDADTV